jgi:hypothetical protein
VFDASSQYLIVILRPYRDGLWINNLTCSLHLLRFTLQPSSLSLHTNVCTDNHANNFASHKHFGLVGIGQKELKKNITFDRKWEVSSSGKLN